MPGAELRIATPSGTTEALFDIAAPLSPEAGFQGFSTDDVIYLAMPDRFRDGDAANNDPAVSRGLFDRGKPVTTGGDFTGIVEKLPYLKELGITALWLNPWYDNVNHLNEKERYDNLPITDYHGYGAVDFYGVEEHFGSLADLRALVEAAHRLGIKVIQDQVANHGPCPPVGGRSADAHVVPTAPRRSTPRTPGRRGRCRIRTPRRRRAARRSTGGSSISCPT